MRNTYFKKIPRLSELFRSRNREILVTPLHRSSHPGEKSNAYNNYRDVTLLNLGQNIMKMFTRHSKAKGVAGLYTIISLSYLGSVSK